MSVVLYIYLYEVLVFFFLDYSCITSLSSRSFSKRVQWHFTDVKAPGLNIGPWPFYLSFTPSLPSALPIYLSGSSESHGHDPERAVSLARVNKCNGKSELRAVSTSRSPSPIPSVSTSSITCPLGSGLLRPRQLCLAPSNVASISFVLKWL